MNPRVRALGETVLRVKDLPRVKRFYTDVRGHRPRCAVERAILRGLE